MIKITFNDWKKNEDISDDDLLELMRLSDNIQAEFEQNFNEINKTWIKNRIRKMIEIVTE